MNKYQSINFQKSFRMFRSEIIRQKSTCSSFFWRPPRICLRPSVFVRTLPFAQIAQWGSYGSRESLQGNKATVIGRHVWYSKRKFVVRKFVSWPGNFTTTWLPNLDKYLLQEKNSPVGSKRKSVRHLKTGIKRHTGEGLLDSATLTCPACWNCVSSTMLVIAFDFALLCRVRTSPLNGLWWEDISKLTEDRIFMTNTAALVNISKWLKMSDGLFGKKSQAMTSIMHHCVARQFWYLLLSSRE